MITKDKKKEIDRIMKRERFDKKQRKHILNKIENDNSLIDRFLIDRLGVVVEMKSGEKIKILK